MAKSLIPPSSSVPDIMVDDGDDEGFQVKAKYTMDITGKQKGNCFFRWLPKT